MKNKNIIIICLFILVIVVLIVSIWTTYTLESSYAKKLPFSNDNQVIAIFFLGGTKETYDYSVVNKYYSENDIAKFETVELEGGESYLVVPRYNVPVTISSLTMTEDGGTAVKFEKQLNKPFFLKCNMSDIFPNSEIKLLVDNKQYVYTPYISLKDGSIVTEEFVMLVEK